MKKINAATPLPYTFAPERMNAKYSMNDGKTWMNHGEFCERMTKAILGYAPTKDAVAFDMGYDLPELKASIKSRKCGLTERHDMPKTPAEFMADFWNREHAELYIYAIDHGEEFNLYMMNRAEFRQFVEHFAKWDAHCVKFRINVCDTKTERWLEDRLGG